MGQLMALTESETFDTLKEKQADAKREIILRAAEKAFSKIPFKEVSMREIAREVGISHATIYRYFPDQQSLFVEAFLRGVEEIEDDIQVIMEREGGHLVEDVAEAFVTFLFDHDHYFKMMSNFMLEGGVAPKLLERINAIARSLMDKFEAVLFKEGGKNYSRVMVHSFFAALNGILITFHDYPGREREEIRQHVKRLARITARVFVGKGEIGP